jgi:hypothetical protein
MKRIFTAFAMLHGLALTASVLSGTVSKLNGGVLRPYEPTYKLHFLLGLATAVLTLLLHCLIFTYFLGTGRWVKEVGLAYGLPDALLPRQTRELKRRAFPPALFAMLITIATAAAGQGAQLEVWPWGVHATLAGLTLIINGWAYIVEYRCLSENTAVLDAVMQEVDRIRAEQGLPPNAEALQEQNR